MELVNRKIMFYVEMFCTTELKHVLNCASYKEQVVFESYKHICFIITVDQIRNVIKACS